MEMRAMNSWLGRGFNPSQESCQFDMKWNLLPGHSNALPSQLLRPTLDLGRKNSLEQPQMLPPVPFIVRLASLSVRGLGLQVCCNLIIRHSWQIDGKSRHCTHVSELRNFLVHFNTFSKSPSYHPHFSHVSHIFSRCQLPSFAPWHHALPGELPRSPRSGPRRAQLRRAQLLQHFAELRGGRGTLLGLLARRETASKMVI